MDNLVLIALIAATPPSLIGIGNFVVGLLNKDNLRDMKKSVNGTQTALQEHNTALQENNAELKKLVGYYKGVIDKWEAVETRNDLLAATPPLSVTAVVNHPTTAQLAEFTALMEKLKKEPIKEE